MLNGQASLYISTADMLLNSSLLVATRITWTWWISELFILVSCQWCKTGSKECWMRRWGSQKKAIYCTCMQSWGISSKLDLQRACICNSIFSCYQHKPVNTDCENCLPDLGREESVHLASLFKFIACKSSSISRVEYCNYASRLHTSKSGKTDRVQTLRKSTNGLVSSDTFVSVQNSH